MKKIWKPVFIVTVIFLLSLYVSVNWYQIALIQGESMEPTYHSWQMVLLDKHTKQLDSGDVVAFRCEGVKGILIKRIVAVPGDVIEIADGILYINGIPASEELVTAELDYAGIAEEALGLKEDMYFVLGDNYEVSRDSRYCEIGCVNREQIIGEVLPHRLPEK